ncbi:MAG: iron-containing alcohol dehydrogenase [Actinomycetota bacterium]
MVSSLEAASLSDAAFVVRPLPEVVFRAGSLAETPARARQLGGRRVLLVTDPGVVAAGLAEQLSTLLVADGLDVTIFDGVEANPTLTNVVSGSEAAGDSDGLVIVALGGGSSMDCAKAIAMDLVNDGPIREYCIAASLGETGVIDPASAAPQRQPTTAVPLIAIPTTSGTASETNGSGVLTDESENRKIFISNPLTRPVVSLLDPELTLGLPPYPTATCGMDALTHAIEAFTSNRVTPYSDAIALQAIRLVGEWLPAAVDDGTNLEARSQLLLGSHMAGVAFGTAGLGMCHALGHPLSAVLHQAHGQTLTTMLPHVMDFNLPERTSRYAAVAEALGAADASSDDDTNAHAAIAAVGAMAERVGIARSISDMGGSSDHLPELVQQAMSDVTMLANPRPATSDDVRTLYLAAF